MAATHKKARSGLSIRVRTISVISIIILVILIANTYITSNIRLINGQVAQQAELIVSQQDAVASQQQAVLEAQSVIDRVSAINQIITTIADMNYWYFQGALSLRIESIELARELKTALTTQVNELNKLDTNNAEAFANALEELTTYELYAERMFVMYESNSVSMGASMAQGAKDQSDKISQILADVRDQYVAQQSTAMNQVVASGKTVSEASGQVSKAGDEIRQQVSASSTLAVTVTLVVIAIGSVLGLLFLRSILLPIQRLSKVIHNIESTNNVSLRTHYERNDELNAIAHAFDAMMSKLQGTIEKMAESAKELTELAHLSHEGSAELSRSVHVQHEETEMVATATTEMSASAANIKQNTDHASALANEALKTTRSSRQAMESSVQNLTGLTSGVTAAAEVINDLAKNTEEIGSVLDVIRGISEQTNLLALNAAIEAARAGEQGRGFAVVADEVRNLASRTNQSTIEIQETVAKLQEGAQRAVAEIDSSKTGGLNNMEQINQAAQTIAEVALAVEQINELNGQIAQASAEQSEVSSSIDASISRISSQVTELSETSDVREKTAESLQQISEQLKALVDSFVTN